MVFAVFVCLDVCKNVAAKSATFRVREEEKENATPYTIQQTESTKLSHITYFIV